MLLTRFRRPGGTGVWALAAVLCFLGSASAQQAEDGFSADERRRLGAGELITRPVERRRGQHTLTGGSSWQVLEHSPGETWRALADTSAYPRLLPATESARVVAHQPGERVVQLRHGVGFASAQYHLRMRFDHDRRDISFRLDPQRRNDLRAAWGFIHVEPYEDDESRTLLSFGAMADPGGGALGGLVRPQMREWMLRVPETVRNYLNGSGRGRYTTASR
ncbi:MAG: SRPBCC family protein [Sandaracinaceae bacterium]